MKIYDISVPLSPSLQVFPGDEPFTIGRTASLAKGDGANVSHIALSCHAGTHVDAPLHFNDHGISVDHLPLTLLAGTARVADLRGVKEIGRHELARLHLKGVERLLLRTDNSEQWDTGTVGADPAHLSMEGAIYLLEIGVRLVGIDGLSIDRLDSIEVHRLLLGNGVVIVECLNLTGVEYGDYELICLPLKITGSDGAPARALLRRDEPAEEHAASDLHTTRWPLA